MSETRQERYRGGDKRVTMLLHAQRRGLERYGIRFEIPDFIELETRAQAALDKKPNPGAVIMGHDEDGVTVESVYAGKCLRYVYLTRDRTLVTFIPRDLVAEYERYRKTASSAREATFHRGKRKANLFTRKKERGR